MIISEKQITLLMSFARWVATDKNAPKQIRDGAIHLISDIETQQSEELKTITQYMH